MDRVLRQDPDTASISDTPTAVVVFEDQDIVAVWQPGSRRDIAIVSFADAVTLMDGTAFFGSKPMGKLGYPCLGFVAKRPHWYPRSSMDLALAATRHLLASAACTVGYGGSMGGYAALRYSATIGFDTVIAFCPQWSIDPAECVDFDPGFQHLFNERMRGMSLRCEDLAGAAFVFVDMSYAQDRAHYQRIARLSDRVVGIHVPSANHHVTGTLAGTTTLHDLVEACRKRDIDAVRRVVRRARRDSFFRRETVAKSAASRHPGLLAPRISSFFGPDKAGPDLTASFMTDIFAHYARRDDGIGAATFKSAVQPRLVTVMQQYLAASMGAALHGRPVVVRTAHAGVLSFDARTVRIVNGLPSETSIADTGGLVVRYELLGELVGLSLSGPGGFTAGLWADDEGGLSPLYPRDGEERPVFRIAAHPGGHFSLGSDRGYVSARPDGSVICTAPAVSAWELFTFD